MKKGIILMVIAFLIGTASWGVYEYARVLEKSGEAIESRDIPKAKSLISDFNSRWISKPLNLFPLFAEKLNYQFALVLVYGGEEKEGMELFSDIIEKSRNSQLKALAYHNLGNLKIIKEADLNEAEKLYKEALKLNPVQLKSKINLELLFRENEKLKESETGETKKRSRIEQRELWNDRRRGLDFQIFPRY